ncbi:MAG: hypothetical protein ACOC33_03155 [bacterium]
MITVEELSQLKTFGRESDGSFSDRWQFSIIPKNKKHTKWGLYFLSEVDGEIEFIKELDDMDDLRDIYYVITYKKLE